MRTPHAAPRELPRLILWQRPLDAGQWMTFPERRFYRNPTALLETFRDLYLKKLVRHYGDGRPQLLPELDALAAFLTSRATALRSLVLK
ncbi:MAG: hypothetical protein R3E01_19615 [Pirellulaceae bacterium]|nr:hypothetical protein [Planctomycetales bacterium]